MALGIEVQVQSDLNQARKRSEAAKKGAITRATQRHARELYERRQDELSGREQPLEDHAVDLVRAEVWRQDEIHPAGYPATRDGIFLGLKSMVHEIDVEAVGAWSAEKRSEVWERTEDELVQGIAVGVRLLRALIEERVAQLEITRMAGEGS